MPFEIVVDEFAHIVRARYSGEVSLEDRKILAGKVIQEAERSGIYRFLLDYRDARSTGAEPGTVKRIADEFAPRLPPEARLAYLLRYDHQLDDSLEVVARSRGVRVERFLDMAAAIGWLKADEPAAPAEAAPPERHSALVNAFKLAGEVVDPTASVSPEQFAALGELAHELLAAGMDEATVRRLVRRMATAMHPPPRG